MYVVSDDDEILFRGWSWLSVCHLPDGCAAENRGQNQMEVEES